MKKTRQCLSLTLAAALMLSACGQKTDNAQRAPEKENITLEAAQQAYLEKVDLDYSYDLALRLEEVRKSMAMTSLVMI